jgi:hypothetical protein
MTKRARHWRLLQQNEADECTTARRVTRLRDDATLILKQHERKEALVAATVFELR